MEILLFILYSLALIAPRVVLPALGLHAVLIVQTAVTYGRVPLIGLHDTLGFLAFAIGLIYGISGWNRKRDLVSHDPDDTALDSRFTFRASHGWASAAGTENYVV